jgi:hypothetical protein
VSAWLIFTGRRRRQRPLSKPDYQTKDLFRFEPCNASIIPL